MAKQFLLYRTTIAGATPLPYVDDRGTNLAFRGRFAIPPDMTRVQAAAIATAAGLQVILPTDPPAICPDPGAQGRKLKFVRQDGSSISLVFRRRDTLIADAIATRTALNAVTATNPVVCIQLEGEYFPNLFDTLAAVGRPPTAPGVSSRPVATFGKQFFYSGVSAYLSDAIYGQEYLLPFKIATNVADQAPNEYAALLTAGNIVAQNAGACPGSDPRTTRRYIIQSLVTEGAGTVAQTAQIPVGTHLPADILAVGQAAAALASTQCLGYKGENNARFHKLLP
jgi:hypothetical protein